MLLYLQRAEEVPAQLYDRPDSDDYGSGRQASGADRVEPPDAEEKTVQ